MTDPPKGTNKTENHDECLDGIPWPFGLAMYLICLIGIVLVYYISNR